MVLHAEAIKNLPADQYAVIEEIHSRLIRFMSDLKVACCNQEQLNCVSDQCEKNGSCRGQLPSYFYDLIDIAGSHFFQEEAVMLSQLNVTEENRLFRSHWQAHLGLMGEVGLLVKECNTLNHQGDTAQAYRHLYHRIIFLFEAHDRAFVDPFLRTTIST